MDNNLNKKDTWIPTPRYLCRKAVVLSFLDNIEHGKFLEVGMGSGDLILDLAKRKYEGLGIDISDDVIEIVQEKLKKIDCNIRTEKIDLFDVDESFGIIILLEVMEHIQDDIKAFDKIYNILNKNGYLIISVPAHKRKWDINDKWAGHFRRYERDELRLKLEKAGFKIIKLYSYGFPIANIAKPIRNYLIKKESLIENNKEMNTKKSGIDRGSQKKFSFMINKFTMAPFLFLQKLFFDKDLGDGYVVLAKK